MFNVNLCFISILRCILTLLILNRPVFGNHTGPSVDETSNRIKVNVSEGTLVGIVEAGVYGDSYNAFRGIPYAKPPVGDLRFQDPQPPEPWFGDRDASFHRNISLQKDIFWNNTIGDEDCLYLNVYTKDMMPLKKRAVMVWIHGRGFFTGGYLLIYGPEYIMRKDVVLVTVKYRLGVLGFLNFYKEMATGNQGLKDVVMALTWVQRNILHFGGDSDNVTIFGQNAGAVMVHYLTISPLAKGLFHKAICQSGAATVPWAFNERDDAINNGMMLAQKLGSATSDPEEALKFLKNINGKKLIRTEAEIGLDVLLAFTPTVDSESPNPLLPENPLQLLRNRITVPIIFGYNTQEGNYFTNSFSFGWVDEEILKEINSDFEKAIYPRILRQLPQLGITVPELRSLYFGNGTVSKETIMDLFDFIGDQYIYRGIMQAIDTQMNSDVNQSTYLYRFSYDSETSPLKNLLLATQLPGTSHYEELGYLFDPHVEGLQRYKVTPFRHGTPNYKIMEYLTQMWADFAKTGNPTLSSANFTWIPVKNGTTYDYLDINNEPQMKILIKGNQRWDWENRLNLSKGYNKLEQFSGAEPFANHTNFHPDL
ncbi:esterase E4-like [Nylanderia fulva]|uniref:esterase E4-like n=1 Tax=Nylanderia fulva TaxID=613905 RepID=UPI0010FB6ED0|nr:esterase E4-like [Nylanderia fulva]XP_029158366.1 esterase E4-like [Nylanderia fulva]XP_029158367.1 esterase E4-like [Nylanderia fulva]